MVKKQYTSYTSLNDLFIYWLTTRRKPNGQKLLTNKSCITWIPKKYENGATPKNFY